MNGDTAYDYALLNGSKLRNGGAMVVESMVKGKEVYKDALEQIRIVT